MKRQPKNLNKIPEIDENKVTEKPPRPLGGRPRIEDSVTLSEEMERFAWETARGFSPAEVAERMGIPGERAVRYATTPIILERVAVLLRDKTHEWRSMQDELLTVCYRQAIRFVAEGKVPWANLQWLIDRLEGQKGMQEQKPPEGVDAKGGKPKGKGGGKQDEPEATEKLDAGVSMFTQIPSDEEGD